MRTILSYLVWGLIALTLLLKNVMILKMNYALKKEKEDVERGMPNITL